MLFVNMDMHFMWSVRSVASNLKELAEHPRQQNMKADVSVCCVNQAEVTKSTAEGDPEEGRPAQALMVQHNLIKTFVAPPRGHGFCWSYWFNTQRQAASPGIRGHPADWRLRM